MAAPSTIINEQNPWPWLDPFDEGAERFFNGRSDDAATLLRMVRGSSVTVLFGKSGLGKTSLLQAGLFPALRKERLLPVYVRLHYDKAAGSLQDQLWSCFVAECKRHEFSYREASPKASRSNIDSLWLYLHQRPLGLVQNGGPPWQPVFVLDQFEEIFTLGGNDSALHEKLFSALGDLLENRIPRSIADRIEEDDNLLDTHDLDTQPYRFLVSLREDYLPDLELWSDQIPRLGPNRYRLLSMGRTQALEAIVETGGSLVNEISANRIVDYMSRNDNGATALPQKRGRRLSDIQVEPALLSLVCSGLNAKRIASNEDQLNTENLVQLGGEIIESFYDERLAPLPAPVHRLIEHELITPDGVRIQYPIQSALAQGEVTREQINQLVGQRILRVESIGDSQRVELVHDRLAAVALKRRQEAELREAVEQRRVEQEEAARRLKKKNVVITVVAVFSLAVASGMFWLYRQADQSRADAEAQRSIAAGKSTALEEKTKELEKTLKDLKVSQQTAETNAKEAVTKAKDAERESQRARTAEQASNAALIEATSVRLAAEGQAIVSLSRPGNSFQGVLQILAAHKILPGVEPYFAMQSAAQQLADVALLIETGAPVQSVAFSPDGKRIVSGSQDNTLRLWDGVTGKPVGEALKGHSGWVQSVAFSPDGKRIVSGSDDDTLRLWNVLDSWADELCAKLPRNMTRDEWKKWVGDIPYQKQCPNLPAPLDEMPVKSQAANRKR